MKNIGITICLIIFASIAVAQPMSTVIKTQALEMGKALVSGDAKTFSKFMLPELIEAGNEARLKNGQTEMSLDSVFALFKQFGGNVESITYGNPGKIVKYKNELQSTLPQTTSVTSPFADVVFSSTLVAISRDEGKNWYFYDTNAGRMGQLKNKAPDVSPELDIPKATPPKITPKQQQ